MPCVALHIIIPEFSWCGNLGNMAPYSPEMVTCLGSQSSPPGSLWRPQELGMYVVYQPCSSHIRLHWWACSSRTRNASFPCLNDTGNYNSNVRCRPVKGLGRWRWWTQLVCRRQGWAVEIVHFSNHGNGETKAEILEDSLENVKQKKRSQEMSLVVQCLRICLAMQGTWVQSLVRELRSHMPWRSRAHKPQLLSLHATTKTQCSQLNKYLKEEEEKPGSCFSVHFHSICLSCNPIVEDATSRQDTKELFPLWKHPSQNPNSTMFKQNWPIRSGCCSWAPDSSPGIWKQKGLGQDTVSDHQRHWTQQITTHSSGRVEPCPRGSGGEK